METPNYQIQIQIIVQIILLESGEIWNTQHCRKNIRIFLQDVPGRFRCLATKKKIQSEGRKIEQS